MDYDDAITMTELVRAIRECKRGVSYKDGPLDWYLHSLMKAKALKTDIKRGRYKLRPGTKVQIYRPKRREAIAPWFKDRVWQRAMINNGVYRDLTNSLIFDNAACQTGKGTEQAIRRTVLMLHRIYRENGSNDGYGEHLDVKQYFPSTPHGEILEMDERRIADKRYLPYLNEITVSTKDERPQYEIDADPYGERGTGLGSPISQLHQVALLDEIDHELKCFCRYMQRYQDDFLILDKERSVCERARETTMQMLAEKGFMCTDKTGVFRLRDGFYYLRKRFILTDTGKVIIKLHPSVPRMERRALCGMKEGLDAGSVTMEDVRIHYQAFIAQASYATGTGLIRDMDAFYKSVFGEKPKYKIVRRNLHGYHQNTRKAAPRGADEERQAPGGA